MLHHTIQSQVDFSTFLFFELYLRKLSNKFLIDYRMKFKFF